MKIVQASPALVQQLSAVRKKGKSVGFVPTMGALHEGHLSLIRKARRENDYVVVSIFVNPLQFGPKEDLKKYPRPWQKDRALLKKEKVDCVFHPQNLPFNTSDFKLVEKFLKNPRHRQMTKVFCGKFRPGHFRGVLVVVAKLFSWVKPTRAYFGAKDYQQATLIQQMVEKLKLPIQMRILATVREKGGLAKSSRNVYLSSKERKRALVISRVLTVLKKQVRSSRVSLKRLKRAGIRELNKQVDQVQYLEFVDPSSLRKLNQRQSSMVILCACYVGKTRLIDNVII